MRILIVRPDKLGDLVATLPMATAIKHQMPDAHVMFMVREYTADLLKIAPDVDEVILFDPKAHYRDKIKLFKSIRTDVVFFPVPKLDLAFYAKLAFMPRRVGSVGSGYRFYSMLYNKRIFEHRKHGRRHESEYNVRMLDAIGLRTDEVPLPRLRLSDEQRSAANEHLLTLFGKQIPEYAVVHPGTGGSSWEWPTERFELLGKWVAQRLGLPIILTGLYSERELLFSLAGVMKDLGCDVRVFVDRPLLELAGVLSQASLVVANSTGPGHLAAALGAPTIGLFPKARALSKVRWGFRGPLVANIEPEIVPRSTCPDCKDCVCMRYIGIDEVTQAAERLVSDRPREMKI